MHLLDDVGGVWRTDLFPWKDIAHEIADQGIVLKNFPDSIRMPGSKSTKHSKGINELLKHEVKDLFDAIRNEEHPLWFKKVSDSHRQSMYPPTKPHSSGHGGCIPLE